MREGSLTVDGSTPGHPGGPGWYGKAGWAIHRQQASELELLLGLCFSSCLARVCRDSLMTDHCWNKQAFLCSRFFESNWWVSAYTDTLCLRFFQELPGFFLTMFKVIVGQLFGLQTQSVKAVLGKLFDRKEEVLFIMFAQSGDQQS